MLYDHYSIPGNFQKKDGDGLIAKTKNKTHSWQTIYFITLINILHIRRTTEEIQKIACITILILKRSSLQKIAIIKSHVNVENNRREKSSILGKSKLKIIGKSYNDKKFRIRSM